MGYVSFWIKALKKPGELSTKTGGNYWYSLDKFTLDCRNKKISTDAIMIYDLKEKLIFSDELPYHDWYSIAPDTYADAYYRYFCIFPFEKILYLTRTNNNFFIFFKYKLRFENLKTPW